jgi:leucyl/phenylalanyl-tRNA--protein transferase
VFVLAPNSRNLRFPPVELASPQGLLAVGGDLRIERLLEAYRHGIFPWYNDGQPILWWSPDPRTVLFPSRLKVSRSLRKTLRHGRFRITLDTDFPRVIRGCAAPRPQSPGGGTWITSDMVSAYTRLHEQGYAHSVEAWAGDTLVGGLYGVALGGAFFGESMFSWQTDASKVAFTYLVRQLTAWGFSLIDCQQATAHLLSLGAEEIPRAAFLEHLTDALTNPDRHGPWRFDSDLLNDERPPTA